MLFVVVGTDRAHYGPDRGLTGGEALRQRVVAGGDFDLYRFHFTGWVPEETLARVLSLSDLHVYLTIPFITSWSMLDAMSCGCVVLASDQACTREYITDGRNGLLCDFIDDEAMARRALEVLDDPAAHRHLGEAARRTIEEKYSLDVCLPRIRAFFEEVAAAGPRTPSVRAEALVRPGKPAWWNVRPKREGEAPAEPGAALPPYDGSVPFYADAREFEKSPSPRPARGRSPDPFASPPGTGEREKRTVLFCWELGAGLGHLMQVLPLATDLARAGHCVVVALRHLERAANVFGRSGVFYLQAPHRAGRRRGSGAPTPTGSSWRTWGSATTTPCTPTPAPGAT